jgi:hypothetical protein
MPHVIVIKAQAVLTNRDLYPEVIAHDAESIIEWSNNKRKAIVALWKNHSVFHQWKAFYRQSKKPLQHECKREATRNLQQIVSKNEMQTLFVAQHYLRKTQVTNAMLFSRFEAMLCLFNTQDITLIHRYLACVNAHRLDDTLESVGFLRWCGENAVSEILAWKMLKMYSV